MISPTLLAEVMMRRMEQKGRRKVVKKLVLLEMY